MSSYPLYNVIAQGLYQGIGVDNGLVSTLWENPDRIGTTNANVGQFTAANFSSINTYGLTAQTLCNQSITYSSINVIYNSSNTLNTLELGVSSLSTYSVVGTTANFPQAINSSISTYSVVGATANFQQLVNSSISTYSIVGTRGNFRDVTTSSLSTYSLTGSIANIQQIVTSTISTFSILSDTANFPQIFASSISTFTTNGTTDFQQVSEVVSLQTNATGVWPHNFNSGSIFYHTNILGNFSTALFNVPINIPAEPIFPVTFNREIIITLILVQGATPYYSPALTVNGIPATIQWIDGILPVPSVTTNANKIDCQTFNIFYINGSLFALGQYLSFGAL